MDAQTINRNYDLLSLAMGDTKLAHAGRFWIGPCPFCGGRDRFNLKATPDGWKWFCRKCGGDQYHTVIDYFMRRDNLDFKQALQALGGDIQIHPERRQVVPAEPEISLPEMPLQLKKLHYIDACSDRLLGNAGAVGRRYLEERGLSIGTAYVYLLGLDPNKFDSATNTIRPAIVIPWFDTDTAGETVTAIKYRFIDELAADTKHRYTSWGKPILFGLHAAAGRDTLILVEGEVNAMSISQESARHLLHIDALSFGSQGGGRKNILQTVARDYRRVIVWADDPEKAKELQAALERPAGALCSPEIDGRKWDANALLQEGFLAEFLQEAF